MTPQDWRNLAITSIRNPADAARTLIAMGFGANILWNALVLVAIGNTLLFSLSNMLLPAASPLPDVFGVPMVYFGIVAGGLSLTALSLFWIGRMMGGTGDLADILVLIVWMQVLRLVVQAVALVLVFIMPLLSALLVFAAALVGVYMLVHFVNQAHRLQSPGRAAFVLIASMLAIVVGLSVILTLVGGIFVGTAPHV